jgi:tetraacyldisaccharide 4'-kinase
VTTTSRTDRFVEGVLHGGDRGLGATLARGALVVLAGLHVAGLEAYLLPYRTGVRKRFRLPVPVIAIGNLTSGGTGKTPMAALVAGHLRDAGRRVVLLSRGHGGSHERTGVPQVVSDGESVLLGPDVAGDEPALLARLLPGVPVVVGRDRRKSGRLAIERFAPDVVVLDDALQFWQLHRDLDLVLLDARRPFDNGFVLPRGLLREPSYHLSRAGIVVLTRADRVSAEELAATTARVQRLAPTAAVFAARHAPLGWVDAATGAVLPTDDLTGRPVLAFSGIADGRAFTDSARALGADVAASRDFGDHHAYTAEEAAGLAAQVPPAGAAITTDKDLVKVGPLWPSGAAPLYALRVGMEMLGPDGATPFFDRLATYAVRR